MFTRYEYYADLNSNRIFRKATMGQNMQEYIGGKWVPIQDAWRGFRISWFPETQLKERMRKAA